MQLSPLRAGLLIVLVTLLAYANSLSNGFVWDDEALVKENSFIRNSTYLGTAFTSDLAHNSHAGSAYYRPLQTATYMVDYQFWGLHPAGYHLTNVLLHLLCALLVYQTIRHFTPDTIMPFVVAIIFAVNPLNTSAVTYIAGRADSLSLAGMLGAFLLHQHYRETGSRSVLCFGAALLCYAGALFSRESAMLFPALLLFVSGRPWRRAFLTALPFAILLGAFLGWRLAVLQILDKPAFAPWDIPAWMRVQIFFRGLATYFSLLLWPAHLQMDRQVAHGSHFLTAAGVLCFAAFTTALVWSAGRNRLVFLGLGWFAIALLPMTGTLNLVATVAEHWLYVPMIGFYLALAAIVPWRQKTTLAAIVLVIAAFTGRTVDRNRDWANGATLFARQTESAKQSERSFTNLGHTQFMQGDAAAGLQTLLRAEQLNPRSTTAKFNLAVVYLKLGNLDFAREKLTECAALDPTDSTLWELVAQIHVSQGRVAHAIRYYRTALTCTRDVGLRLRYAQYLTRHGRAREALALTDECLQLEPGNAEVFRFLGELLQRTGHHAEAANAFQFARSLDRHS